MCSLLATWFLLLCFAWMKTRVEKKKLTIKPFASTPTLPPDFEEHAWDRLQRAVEAVIAEKAIDISKEELYRVSEALYI